MMFSKILFSISLFLLCTEAFAQGGHGPVFGYATPTNSQGEWSFDVGALGRAGSDTAQMTARTMVGYGFTPYVTLWTTVPVTIGSGNGLAPTVQAGGDDFESKVAWRFHHKAKPVGTRIESTASVGLVVPGPQTGEGVVGHLRRAAGFDATLVSGLASRSQYFWVGGGYRRFAKVGGDRRPDIASYSVVYGYRPRSWRKEADSWDWRIFAEMTGERTGAIQAAGAELPHSETHQLFLGPSMLGIYHQYAVEAGVQFPVYQAAGNPFVKDRARFAVNFSYFLFQSHQH